MSGRPQVPPGTRNARTGAYIRKPVPVRGGGSGGSKSGCPLVLLGWLGYIGCAAAVVARVRGWSA